MDPERASSRGEAPPTWCGGEPGTCPGRVLSRASIRRILFPDQTLEWSGHDRRSSAELLSYSRRRLVYRCESFGGSRGRSSLGLQSEVGEEQLILAARRGDRDAFAALYKANVDRVYYYLLRRVSQPADAEDVAAEVFIRAMQALPSYKPQGVPFIAWLLRIAHNSAVNYVRKQARRQEVVLQEAVDAPHDTADMAMAKVAAEEVSQAMGGLTQLQRQVLGLRFRMQLSIAETAEKMKRSESAVKFLQHSAIRALRRVMSPPEEADKRGR